MLDCRGGVRTLGGVIVDSSVVLDRSGLDTGCHGLDGLAWTLAWPGHLPGLDFCLAWKLAWPRHLPGLYSCLASTWAWPGHLPGLDIGMAM